MLVIGVASVLVLCACAPRPTPAPESPPVATSEATEVAAPQPQLDAGPVSAPVADAGTQLSLLRHDRVSADAGAAASQPLAPQIRSTGVPECDYYLQRYLVCARDHVPAASRAIMDKSILTMSEAWRKTAETPAGRKALVLACKTALQTVKKTMAAFNCQW